MPAPTATVEQMRQVLSRHPAVSASGLAQDLNISVPTVHRLLQRLPQEQLVVAGKARRTRYALARPLRGATAPIPTFRVDREGQLHAGSDLRPLQPHGSWMDLGGSPWPVPEDERDGWWPGLPYPLQQMRPQGYMGRQLAHAEHLRLQVPQDLARWSDDDSLYVMSQVGSDLSGDLIVGEAACQHWLAERAQDAAPVPPGQLLAHYTARAAQAVARGVAGSSAAGEFPKFTARRELAGAATPHVIVKFSGAESSATVQRWADLLVCEHLALAYASRLPGVQSARTRVLNAGGRTFLEVERFDRHGAAGRSPLCALDVIDAAFVGSGTPDWPAVMARLLALGLIDEGTRQAVLHLWWFGRLIANSDMHAGNLSFVPQDGRLALAPAYDMLPMRLTPLAGGEVPHREPEFSLPMPAQREAWLQACKAALAFWQAAATDVRISEGFRAICAAHGDALLRLRDRA